MLIDTHLHLVDRARLSYPWLGEEPPLDRDWRYEDYARVARRVGITGALHMEVDVAPEDIGAETAMVAELARREGSLIRGAIASARPEDEGFEAALEGMDRATVRGIRRVLHVVPDGVSQSATFRANVARIGAAGLPFDICMRADQLPLAAALVDACDQTVFVLDHCGVPDIAGGGFASWARDIAALAERPNVNCKISGLPTYATPEWTLDDLRPYVEHVIACFGWDRVVWGSDSPVCTLNASLEQWVAATLALTQGVSEDERARLFHRNAARIWGL